jgi:uncharacterized membrane protein YeiH
MNYSESIIYIFELIGTVAFASSGAMVGIRKNMDIFGVNMLGIMTAVGGGCIRDIILGITPPKMFQNFSYVGASILISCILFSVFYVNQRLLASRFLERYERIMISLDAIGLGVFTVMGIRTAIGISYEENIFLLIFVGTVTGIGGGMLRDIMAGMTPFVFVKHVYAIASILGAVSYIILRNYFRDIVSVFIGAAVVIIIRLLAAHFHWNLPRIHTD